MTGRAALLALPLFLAACGAAVAPEPPVPSVPAAAAPIPAAAASVSSALGEKRSDAKGIEVVATWASAAPPSLKLTLDTHSGDLDQFDLAVLAHVRVDGADWVAPTAVDAPKGGHHRAGTLTFASIPAPAFASARSIDLRIADVGVPERLFHWERS